MLTTHARRRVARLAAVLPVASALAVVSTVATPGSASAATSPYSGSASADLVNVGLVDGLLADLSLAPAVAQVSSTGGLTGGKQSRGYATNLNAALINGAVPANNLLVSAEQTALPDNATAATKTLLSVPLAPALTTKVADVLAHARWNANGCIPVGTPIARGRSQVADPSVLPSSAAQIDLINDEDEGGAVYTESTVGLVNVAGQAGKGVQSKAQTQVTSIDLLNGLVSIDVVAPPVITATATGKAGGATVTYSEPILHVTLPAGPPVTLDAPGESVAIPGVGTLSLGTLEDKATAADGTSASGTASLLTLTVPALNTTISVARATVAAKVPVGGVDCAVVDEDNPLRDARKDLSAASVNPGQQFDYIINVPNRGSCTLTDVKVVDTVDNPAGHPLELVKSVPTVSSSSGGTYTYDDIGPIAPNETKKITLTFKVPSDAPIGAHYANHADISAVCNGKTYTKDVDVDGPLVDEVGTGGCKLSDSNKASSHTVVYKGETFNYYVHVFNSGGQPCHNVKVHDDLVDGVEFVSCTYDCTHSGQVVDWSIGTVAAGESRTLTVTVKAVAEKGTRLPNTATISSDDAPDTSPSTPGPIVGDESVPAPPDPAVRTPNLAHTGQGSTMPLLAVLSLLVAAAIRRRHASLDLQPSPHTAL